MFPSSVSGLRLFIQRAFAPLSRVPPAAWSASCVALAVAATCVSLFGLPDLEPARELTAQVPIVGDVVDGATHVLQTFEYAVSPAIVHAQYTITVPAELDGGKLAEAGMKGMTSWIGYAFALGGIMVGIGMLWKFFNRRRAT